MKIRAVWVVVPACNEEALLGRCLDAIAQARSSLARVRPDLAPPASTSTPVRRHDSGTIVALDRCIDGTAAVAARAGVDSVTLEAGSVGAARRIGTARAGRRAAADGVAPDEVWIATTDADTVVGPGWLRRQVALAEQGADLVLGRVRPAPGHLSAVESAVWSARHAGEDHIHGANLGFRLSAYQRAGGFPEVTEHEDVALVQAMRALGVREDRGAAVLTSARLDGRTPGGFAGYLRALREEVRPDAGGVSLS